MLTTPEAGKPKVFYTGDNLVVYTNGRYEMQFSDGGPMLGGSIAEYYDIISAQYNQLKAKLYNLVEASVTDKEQREALKGLIKGFCNEHFRNTEQDMHGLLARLQFFKESDLGSPIAEPLEAE